MTPRGRSWGFPKSTLPPRIYPFFLWLGEVSLDPRIYPCLLEYTPFSTFLYVWPSQNLPLFLRIYSLFNNYMRPSRNLPPPPPFPEYTPFLTTICDPPRIYPSFPEYTSSLVSYYIWPSQNLPLPPRIYPPFQHLVATLPESTPLSQNIPPFQQPFASLPEYTLFLTTMCDPPRIYPSLPPSQNIPPFSTTNTTLSESTPPSQNIPPPFQLVYAPLPESAPTSQNIPPPPQCQQLYICDQLKIYPYL